MIYDISQDNFRTGLNGDSRKLIQSGTGYTQSRIELNRPKGDFTD